MGDLTAVEHVQRQMKTNRKPRTALLAEVFGRGEHPSTATYQMTLSYMYGKIVINEKESCVPIEVSIY